MAEELNIEQQVKNPNDKIKILYNTVSKDYDLGDFNEFSKKLQNPDSRKKFYDVVGKEFDLGGYNDFIERVTITPEKKNLGFQGVSTNFPITSVSPLQKSAKEALQEGAGLADNSFLRQINASNPLIGVLPKDEGILPTNIKGLQDVSLKEIRKERKEPKQYYNSPLEKGVIFTGDTEMMAPGSKITEEDAKKLPLDVTIKNKFAQDYIEKIRREPTNYEVEGSYFDGYMDPMGGIHLTIAQNAIDQFVSKAAEIGAGAATWLRDNIESTEGLEESNIKDLYAKGGELTQAGKSATWFNDPLGKVVLGLNGIKSDFRGDLQYNGKLPDTMFGKLVSGGIGILPDIAAVTLLPEVELFEGAGLLAKAGKFFTKKFPLYLGGSRAIGEYGEAREAGETSAEAVGSALEGGVKGYGEGLAMELAGILSGKATRAAMKPLEKMGITGAKGQITKEGINTITDAIGYGALVPLASAGMEGRTPTADEYIQGVGLSLPFSAMRIFKNARTNAQLNDAVNKIEALQAGISLANFVDATTPSIVDVFNGKETAAELNLKSLEFAKKARETTDLKLKQDYIIQSTIAKKAANVKQIAETVVNDKNGFKEFRESNLPEDIKQAFLDKAAEVYKELNPTEQQKTDLGKRITQAQTFVDDLTNQMNAETDPVKKAELKYQIDQTTKLLEKQNIDLTDIIAKQAKEREEYNKEEPQEPTKKIRKPSQKKIQKDIDNGNIVSFTYANESEVPEPFKNNITSTGETNGVKFVRVSVPKSVADYELSKIKEPIDVPLVTEPTEIKGFKVIKRAQDGPNGEPVYEVEGGRFLTVDGKELKGAKVELPKKEVKPIEENKLKQYNRKGTITPDVINLKYDDNGKEVGGMTLGKYKNYLTLDHIYFSPEYRGTGLSKYAYKDALEIAKNQGYEGLMVGGQLTTEYKTKETYKNFATKELDIKNEKGNPYILLTDWIGKENIEETPEIRLMSPEKVKTTLYHGTNDLLQGDIKMSREGIKMSPERLASGSSKEGWGFYTTPHVEQSEAIARELNPNTKDFPAGFTNEPAVKYSSFGGISPDKGFIYEIKLDPSAKVAYDNGLVKDFKNIKKQEFEKLRSLGIDAIYSSGEYVILNPSKIISNKIVLKNTGKKLVNVIPMGERGKLEMNKYKAVTPENLNSYLESILGKGYKKGSKITTGDKEGMTIYYNPTTDQFAAVQTGVRPNWEKVEEVKPSKGIYFNKLHKSEKFDDDASVRTYLGEVKGEKNIFYTLPNKGIIAFKETKNNTNRFSLTANAKNDTPSDIKNAFKRIEKYLPPNHELVEDKSISVDGLRVWDNFIKNGKYEKTGETNEIEITPIDKTNLFKNLKYTTETEWSGAKFENNGGAEALARVEKYIKDNNLDFKVKLDGDVIKVEVPVLKYNPTKEVKPTEVKVEVEEKIEPVVTQKEIKSTANKIRSLKIKLDKNVLQSNIAGVPIAVYNVAIESIARAVEAGETIAKAVKDAIKKYKLDENKGFNLDEFTNGITSKLPTSKYKKGDVLDIEEGDYKTAAKVIKQNKDNFKKNPEAVTPEPQLDKNGNPKIEVTVGDDGKRSVQIIYKSVPYNLENGSLKFVSKDRKKAIDVLSDKLVADYNENKDKPEISAAIGWYGNMRNWFQKNFGANIEMFGQLLAATSARTEVVDNFKQAVEAMRNLSKGKYDELLKDYDNHIKSIKELSDSELLKKWQEKNPNKRLSEFVPNDYRRFLINQYEKVPLRSNGKKFNANSKKVLQALHGNWIEQTEGPKTKNFAGNLTGRSFEATIDVWAARYLRRKIYEGKAKEWRILPQSEGGVQYGKLKSGGMSGDYPFAEEVMKKAADKLGVKADDLQAFLWYLEKDVWDKNNWTNVIGKKKASFEEAAKGVASDRYQAAVTTFRTPETFDPVKFEQERKGLENEIGKIPGIIISRVNASEGEFRSATDIFIEPTYDVEFTVDKNADISNVIRKVNEIQAKYDQDATIISRFVDANHPNARPIIEIGLAEPVEKSDIIEDIKKTLSDLDVRGFTIARDRQGKILGVRSQFVPEFEDNVKMEEGLDRFATAFQKIKEKYGENKKISYLSTNSVDSQIKFKENGTTENEQNDGNRPPEQGIQGELPREERRPTEGIRDVSKEQGEQNGGQRNRAGNGMVPESEIPGIGEQKTTSKEKVQGIVANVRKAKIDLSKLSDGGPQLNILGLPVAVYNAALETIAVAIESGATLADAIAYAIEKHKLERKEKFNKQELIKKLEELTGEKVESDKEITEKLKNKPRTLADEFADAEKRKSEKSIQNAKNKIIKDNFGKIVDELLNNKKIDRIC